MNTKYILILAGTCLFAGIFATQAAAKNTFQNSCSNIEFAYSGKHHNATIDAVCLNTKGEPKSTSLVLKGIDNQNGVLTQAAGNSSDDSTFQKSCGNIQILVDGPEIILSAICAMSDGNVLETSLALDGISNANGKLTQ